MTDKPVDRRGRRFCSRCDEQRGGHGDLTVTGCPVTRGRRHAEARLYLLEADLTWVKRTATEAGETPAAVIGACIRAARALGDLDGLAAIGLGKNDG